MATPTRRSLLERPRRRAAHPERESGSLVLDILIGMAIFALVAIIAVSAVGQYRMRAYIQAAMSDAEAVANAVNAAITDKAGDDSETPLYPTGLLTADELTALEVTPTSTGTQTSEVTVIPSAVRPEDFTICVEYRGAYAEYESDEGLTASGNIARDGFLGCDATFPDDGNGNGDGDGDGGDGDGDDTALAAPVARAEAIPGQDRATISWDAVDTATSYAVFLDGATTATWTGPDLSTVLTGLPTGEHSATVTAANDTETSAASEPVSFTIYCDNNRLACAHPVDVPAAEGSWTTVDYDNSTANGETGEPTPSRKSIWWTMTAPRDATYTFRVVAPTSGTAVRQPTIGIWNSTATDVTALGTSMASAYDQVAIQGRAGETYKIRIIDSCGCTGWYGPMRLRVHSGPSNDMLHDAMAVDPDASTWYSPVIDTTWAGGQAGEPTPRTRSVWWTITPTRSTTFNVRTVAATSTASPFTQSKLKVYRTSSTDVTALGTPILDVFEGGQFDGVVGQTYQVQVFDPCNCNGYYGPMRLKVDQGPANDNIAAAMDITGLTPATPWFSPVVDNTFAGGQTGEPTPSRNSTWYTLTVPRDSAYTISGAAPVDGTTLRQYGIKVWRTSATDVTTLGTTTVAAGLDSVIIDGRAGETYKIQFYDPCGCADYRGQFRVRVIPGPANDSLTNAEAVPTVAAGGTWHSPDLTNANAAAQRGESGGNKGVWWTFTPTRSGSYTFRPVAPSTSTTAITQPMVTAWQTNTTDVALLGSSLVSGYDAITLNAVAGQTYKVRVHDPCGCAGWSGPLRLRVTG